ncbi:zinc-binding dehydrogenase [Rhodococcus koreensis]
MRAAILEHGETQLNVVADLEVRDPGPGEVRVRIAYCGLCHSDKSVIDATPDETPIVIGHEASGTVDSVGAGVSQVSPGDSVVLTTKPSCGRCYWCSRGRPTICINNQSTALFTPLPDGSSGLRQGGRDVLRGLGVAGFAEMVITTPDGLTRIDPDTPLDIAAVLGCGVRTGVGAVVNTAKVAEGDSVLILGLGGVGMSMVMGANLASAATIIVSDPVAERRAAAIDLGATIAVDPAAEDVIEVTMKATGGRGVDYAFDAVGSAKLVATGFDATTPGGAVVVVGIGSDATYQVPLMSLMVEEKRLLGSLIGSSLVHRDVPRLLGLWRSGRLDLDRLVTSRRPIEEINAGFDDLAAGIGLRTVVAFN